MGGASVAAHFHCSGGGAGLEQILTCVEKKANAGPSTSLRSAQDDKSEKSVKENRQQQGRNAGPSTFHAIYLQVSGELLWLL
jgi:hypothetical protein